MHICTYVCTYVCMYVCMYVCIYVGLLLCWFVGWVGCWLVGCLIELSLLVCGVSGPANPGTVAEWPAGQLDPAPLEGAAVLNH